VVTLLGHRFDGVTLTQRIKKVNKKNVKIFLSIQTVCFVIKGSVPKHRAFYCIYLLEADRLGRALSSAGAALETCISIDHVLVGTLGDGLHGALSSAAAALHAIIGNNVCHYDVPPVL
jgi:hypothetical protein